MHLVIHCDKLVTTSLVTNWNSGGLMLKMFSFAQIYYLIFNIVFGSFSGIDGYSFLSFDGNGQATTVLSGTGLDDISILSVPGSNVTQVSAPSTILMFALVLMGMATVRRR